MGWDETNRDTYSTYIYTNTNTSPITTGQEPKHTSFFYRRDGWTCCAALCLPTSLLLLSSHRRLYRAQHPRK